MPKTIHITQYINFSNTGIICLPNYFTAAVSQPNINNIPVCVPGNTNGCATYADLSGRTYHDKNHNCTFEGADQGQYGLKHSLYSNGILLGQTYSNSAGNYSFDVNAYGNYETRLDTTGLPFIIGCPTGGVYYDTLTANDSTHFNRDFALQCETGFDLAAQSVASAMVFRPANNTVVDVHAGDLANFYSASCAQGVSGTVTVKLHGPISYIAPATNALAPSNASNNVITWNVADFGTANALTDFNIIIQTDTFAQSGQQACFEVNVTPLAGDNDTSNNHIYYCFDIVNSYDPNDKTAYPSGNIDTTQEWLTYRVRFQNTGTAEAQHIYIMDTLDANVQVETFQLLSYSHQPNVQIKENIVRFNFPFINLPDSNTNEPGSHGYVQYKVKLKEDLPIGTTINNTAYIYFDFNPPVVTNTATNTIAVEEDTVEVGMNFVPRDFGIALYPNPANSQVTISTSTPCRSVSIIDTYGRVVLTQSMNGTSSTTISIANLPSGVYYVNVGNGVVKKLVKQ
ncbi:MAG: T9SS type A sorting domain-containing protein [Bacteroidetes bacterium]|nr:T9SS type A sorting domain-containing protein [Bacteroidota bacterium]